MLASILHLNDNKRTICHDSPEFSQDTQIEFSDIAPNPLGRSTCARQEADALFLHKILVMIIKPPYELKYRRVCIIHNILFPNTAGLFIILDTAQVLHFTRFPLSSSISGFPRVINSSLLSSWIRFITLSGNNG